MSGTTEGGKKAAAKVRQEYGVDAYAKWGGEGHKARKTSIGGLNDPNKVKEIATKGGATGHRARKITTNDKLRPDEWGVLLKIINSTAGKIRLAEGEGSFSAMEQHAIYHRVFEYWEKEDWVGAMTKISTHPMWIEVLGELLEETSTYYTKKAKGTPRLSEDRELARIYRNLLVAYRSATGNRK